MTLCAQHTNLSPRDITVSDVTGVRTGTPGAYCALLAAVPGGSTARPVTASSASRTRNAWIAPRRLAAPGRRVSWPGLFATEPWIRGMRSASAARGLAAQTNTLSAHAPRPRTQVCPPRVATLCKCFLDYCVGHGVIK
jgi:hypothetical protein